MTFLKSQKRFGQFETLEAKKLFAADLAASADVVSINPGECITAFNPGDCTSAFTAEIIDPNDGPSIVGSFADRIPLYNNPGQSGMEFFSVVDPQDDPSLGGQEGELVSGPATGIVPANLGNLQNYGGAPKSNPSR